MHFTIAGRDLWSRSIALETVVHAPLGLGNALIEAVQGGLVALRLLAPRLAAVGGFGDADHDVLDPAAERLGQRLYRLLDDPLELSAGHCEPPGAMIR
jgi:hypothetical protein